MYSENRVAKPFLSIYRGPGSIPCHWHTHQPYEGTLARQPEPVEAPSAANPSSSQQSFRGGKQSTQKLSRAARERATAGPSRGMLLLHFPFLVIDQAVVSSPQQSAGGEAKWEESDLPDIPKPHGLFGAAWKKADKSSQRVRSGQVNPGYHFPKLTLFVNVSTPERKKTYLLNWLSARALWMSQVDV